jgi:hypothetical protein
MFSIKTRSAFEKYLRFMNERFSSSSRKAFPGRAGVIFQIYLSNKVVLVHVFGGAMEKYVNLFNSTSPGFEIRIVCALPLGLQI